MTYTRQQVADKALSLIGTRFLHQGRSRLGVDCVGFLHVILTELGYDGICDVEGYKASPPARVIYETMCLNFDEIPVNEVGVGDIYLMRIGGRKIKHASVLVSDITDLESGIEPEIVHAYAIGTIGKVIKEPLRQWLPACAVGFRLRGLECHK
jgi:hypothetical protein